MSDVSRDDGFDPTAGSPPHYPRYGSRQLRAGHLPPHDRLADNGWLARAANSPCHDELSSPRALERMLFARSITIS